MQLILPRSTDRPKKKLTQISSPFSPYHRETDLHTSPMRSHHLQHRPTITNSPVPPKYSSHSITPPPPRHGTQGIRVFLLSGDARRESAGGQAKHVVRTALGSFGHPSDHQGSVRPCPGSSPLPRDGSAPKTSAARASRGVPRRFCNCSVNCIACWGSSAFLSFYHISKTPFGQ